MEMLLLLKRGRAKVVLDNEEATVREGMEEMGEMDVMDEMEVEEEVVVVESDLDAEAEVVEDGVDLDEDLQEEVQNPKDLKNNLLENLLLSKEKGVTGNSNPLFKIPPER